MEPLDKVWADTGFLPNMDPTVEDQVRALAKALPAGDQPLSMMNPWVGAEAGAATEVPPTLRAGVRSLVGG